MVKQPMRLRFLSLCLLVISLLVSADLPMARAEATPMTADSLSDDAIRRKLRSRETLTKDDLLKLLQEQDRLNKDAPASRNTQLEQAKIDLLSRLLPMTSTVFFCKLDSSRQVSNNAVASELFRKACAATDAETQFDFADRARRLDAESPSIYRLYYSLLLEKPALYDNLLRNLVGQHKLSTSDYGLLAAEQYFQLREPSNALRLSKKFATTDTALFVEFYTLAEALFYGADDSQKLLEQYLLTRGLVVTQIFSPEELLVFQQKIAAVTLAVVDPLNVLKPPESKTPKQPDPEPKEYHFANPILEKLANSGKIDVQEKKQIVSPFDTN